MPSCRPPRESSLRVGVLALLALAAAAACSAQTTAAASEVIRSSAEALVNATFHADGPGGTVIVVKDGATVYRAARGMASLELGVPLQPDSVMRLASVSKQFTSAAVMLLADQGKLALDDDITKFLPDYPTHGKRITIEHLLTHTSGIKSYTGLPAWPSIWGKDFTTSELIDLFKNEPMDFEPGEKYRYNNSAYFLLGAIIEKASGLPYAEFLKVNIFAPLGMTNTRYGDTGPIIKGRVQGYAPDPPTHGYVNAQYLSMTQPGAAGGLLSTVDDLAKWDAAVSSGRLLKPESWQRIFTPYRLKSGRSTGYGFGWQIGTFNGKPVYEHGGGIHGFSTYVIRLPQDHVYVAVLTNNSGGNAGGLARKLAALASGAPLVNPKAITLAPGSFAEYAGVYQFDEDVKIFIRSTGAGLSLQVQGGGTSVLLPMAPDKFFVTDSFNRYTFERNAAGKVTGVTRDSWSGADKGRLTAEPLPETKK